MFISIIQQSFICKEVIDCLFFFSFLYKVEHVLRLLGFIQLILFFNWLLQYEYESVYS